MKVLVTGGNGFLGGNIVHSLSKNKNLVVSAPSRSELNLLNRNSVDGFLRDLKPDIVVHAAAVVGGIGANHKHNFDFLVSNSVIDSNLLSVCSDLNIDKLVSFGSSCMYPPGTGRALGEDEVDPKSFEPTNEGYAIAKKHLYDLVKFVREEKGFSWTQLVLSNLYGPGDNFDPGSSHLLAAIINKLLSAENHSESRILIWGSGKPRREFTFVTDVSTWISDFVVSDAKKWPLSLNLGYGKDYSVQELYRLAAQILGWEGEFELDLSKPDGAMDKLMDSSLARNSFSWNPKTDIETGIRQSIDWRKSHP